MKYGLLDQSRNQSEPSDRWSKSQNLVHQYFEKISKIYPLFCRYCLYISNIFPISPTYLRYFTDIVDISSTFCRYFIDIFLDFPTHTRMMYMLDISPKYRYFPIFHKNNGDLPDIFLIFCPTDFRLAISCRYQMITDISMIYQLILPIFCSLSGTS